MGRTVPLGRHDRRQAERLGRRPGGIPLVRAVHERPRAHERAFVLGPWAQVQPGWVLAPAGLVPAPVQQWWLRVADDPDQAVVPLEGDDWWR